MNFSQVLRPLALAGVMSAAAATAVSGQTVVIRGIPAGSAAEVVQGAAVATGTADAGGDAVINGNLTAAGDTRVNLFVDVCDGVRKVVIVDRDATPPAAAASCVRTPISGLFVVRPVSTLVINLSTATPTVLLRQGPFDFRQTYGTGGVEPPAGLMVFGGGGWSKLHNARVSACGDIAECPGTDSGFGYGGGIAYWLTPYAGVEASYYRPKRALFEGAVGNSLFQTTEDPHVLLFQAKLGIPAGPVRIYGMGGASYHRATLRTSQEDPVADIDDEFELRTAGWGWTFGGGLEAWVAPKVALFAEGGRVALKGGGVESGGEGSLDERMTYIFAGLRINLSR